MQDRRISAGRVVAYSLWVAAIVVLIYGWVIDLAPLRALALMICGAAMTATIRSYFITLEEAMKTAMTVTATARDAPPISPIR